MPGFVTATVVPALYLLSAVLFVFGLKGQTRVRTARRGNALFQAGACWQKRRMCLLNVSGCSMLLT